MKLSKITISLLLIALAYSATACDFSKGGMKTTTGETIKDPAATPDDNTPPPPPPECKVDADCKTGETCKSGVCEAPPPPKEITVEGIDAQVAKEMAGLWTAKSFDKKLDDGTSEDMLKVYDKDIFLSIDGGGNAKFTYTSKSGTKREDADQVQAVSPKALIFEKQGKVFALKIEGDTTMTFTGMPNNADDEEATDDIVWTRVPMKGLPGFPNLPKPPSVQPTPSLKTITPGNNSEFCTKVIFKPTFNVLMDLDSLKAARILNNKMAKIFPTASKLISGTTYSIESTKVLAEGTYQLEIPGGSANPAVKGNDGTPLDKTTTITFQVKTGKQCMIDLGQQNQQ